MDVKIKVTVLLEGSSPGGERLLCFWVSKELLDAHVDMRTLVFTMMVYLTLRLDFNIKQQQMASASEGK